jgi:palmitoyl transferase
MALAARPLCRIALLATLVLGNPALAACEWAGLDWLTQKCDHAVKAFKSGAGQLYLTGYSYHGRGTYTDEKIDSFAEQSWGGGYGRLVADERDNSHEVYAMAFRDSHAKPQYQIGYAWLARWGLAENLRLGLGLTVFLGLRSDYCNYLCPVPVILPLGSLEYRKVSLMASYVPRLPGEEGNGDVIFLFGRIALE